MNKYFRRYPRILAVAPSTKDFGYAVLEGHKELVDCGVKPLNGDKNVGCLKKVAETIDHHKPQVLVLEDTAIERFRCSRRIKALTKRLIAGSERRTIKVARFSQGNYGKSFLVMTTGQNIPAPKSSPADTDRQGSVLTT